MFQYFSIAWHILVNLATGGVILAMFHIANSPFETIVISALVLIYVVVTGSSRGLFFVVSQKSYTDLARYIAVARSLHLNTGIEEEEAQKELRELEKDSKDMFIDIGSNMLFGLFAIGNLVYAVT